jgi:hypothetical protein
VCNAIIIIVLLSLGSHHTERARERRGGGRGRAPEVEGVEAGKERQASAEARRPSWAHSVPAACVWRGGGSYAMDADGLGFPLRVRAGATTRTYSRMLRRGWITPADTTRVGWPGVGGAGLVPRVTVWRRPARRRRGAVGLWKADSKAMLSLSSASLTRKGRGENRSDTSAPPYNAHRSTLAHTRPFGCIRLTPRMAAVRVGSTLATAADSHRLPREMVLHLPRESEGDGAQGSEERRSPGRAPLQHARPHSRVAQAKLPRRGRRGWVPARGGDGQPVGERAHMSLSPHVEAGQRRGAPLQQPRRRHRHRQPLLLRHVQLRKAPAPHLCVCACVRARARACVRAGGICMRRRERASACVRVRANARVYLYQVYLSM